MTKWLFIIEKWFIKPKTFSGNFFFHPTFWRKILQAQVEITTKVRKLVNTALTREAHQKHLAWFRLETQLLTFQMSHTFLDFPNIPLKWPPSFSLEGSLSPSGELCCSVPIKILWSKDLSLGLPRSWWLLHCNIQWFHPVMAHCLPSALKGSNSSKEAEPWGHSSALKGNSRVRSSHTQVNPLASFPSSFHLLLKRLRWEFPTPCYSSSYASIFQYLVNMQLFAPELYHTVYSPRNPGVLCYHVCEEML